MKAGVSSVCITPEEPIWLAGFARSKRSEGKYQDLFLKALAIEDENGGRAVLVTADLIGFGRPLSESIKEKTQARFGLEPARLLLNASHTHCGPVVRGCLHELYPEYIPAYSDRVEDCAIEAIGAALNDLEEALLFRTNGACTLGVSRRKPLTAGAKVVNPWMLPNPQGPTDPNVPVLKVTRADGSPKAVLFSYSCHPTAMGGYLIGGDFPGFAQQFLEDEIEGATAMFLQGGGGDQKPRNVDGNGKFKSGPLEVVEGFGRELAQAVLTALAGELTELKGPIAARLATFDLPLQPLPSRKELEERARDKEDWRAEGAKSVLERLDAGEKLPCFCPFTVQVIAVGEVLAAVGLSGELCVDYVLRLKREIKKEVVFILGYCNEIPAYIPSARMIHEGGYEAERSLPAFSLPTPFVSEIEEIIVGKVKELCAGVQ